MYAFIGSIVDPEDIVKSYICLYINKYPEEVESTDLALARKFINSGICISKYK